ncbi:hypothetical protein BH09ACT12_BH09ACT12_11010 [soil metagenome]
MRRPTLSLAALIVAGLALLAAAATVLTGRQLVELTAQRELAGVAAEDVSVVATAVREQVDAAEILAAAPPPGSAPSLHLPVGVDASVGVIARDSGGPVLIDTGSGMAVFAVYDTATPPVTVQERRDHVTGYLTVPLDLTTALSDLAPASGGIAVAGPDNTVAAVPSSPPERAIVHTVSFVPDGSSQWSLTVWRPASRTPTITWLLALTIVVGGGVGTGMIAVRQRASRRRLAELAGLQRSNAAVAALAVVTQQSLDLGEALPALSTELATSLGLRGITLTTAAPEGDRALFSWGAAPGEGRAAASLTQVPGGETVWLRLSRGGRTAARLRVVTGRRLDRHDVLTLVAAAELLSSALTNSDAFAEQQNLVDRMQSVDEMKSVFLATASHELRTPVVAVAGYANLLQANWENLAPEQARSLVERVDRSAQRLTRMVEDLLDFSRLEQGKPPDEEHEVLDLGEVVDQVLREQRDLAPEHQVTYRPATGVLVKGSRQALERVVTNLVGNAAKYSPAKTEIRTQVQVVGGQAHLVVEDDGPGIAAADRDRIFSRFYRGHGDEVTRTRGTGLGLAIVTEFAASMGGTVDVGESDSGGARFVVTFPLVASYDGRTESPLPATVQAGARSASGVRDDHT